MAAVRTYKALDYPMKLYGFWPADLAAVALVFITVHGVLNSLLADAFTVGPALYLAWRARKRPPRYVTSLFGFCCTPDRYAVALGQEECSR